MLEPISIHYTATMLFACWMMVLSVATPSQYAPEIASIFMGIIGGLMVQLATSETRKPTRAVMISDIMARALTGLMVPAFGVRTTVMVINKLLPEGVQIEFEPSDQFVLVVVLACIGGIAGAGLFRKVLDRLYPKWMRNDGTTK